MIYDGLIMDCINVAELSVQDLERHSDILDLKARTKTISHGNSGKYFLMEARPNIFSGKF
jgi:hypothetical protein